MGKMLSFRPLNIAKRKWRDSFPTNPSNESSSSVGQLDPEKHLLEDESEWDDTDSSNPSSRATSNSYQQLLRTDDPHDPSRIRRVNAYLERASQRKRCNLYFSFTLASMLVIVVLGLVYAHFSSVRAVESYEPPPKKPPWEDFPFLKRYHGGIRNLVNRTENHPEYPGEKADVLESILRPSESVPDDGIEGLQREESNNTYVVPASTAFDPIESDPQMKRKECYIDPARQIKLPQLQAYNGVVSGFPNHIIGSYEMLGLRNDVCFDRFGRLGPYGLGYSQKKGGTGACLEGDHEGAEVVWQQDGQVDFRKIRWAEAMTDCLEQNQDRFAEGRSPRSMNDQESAKPLNRSVVVIRTWHDYEYDAEDVLYLRALISELSLASGMEYVVHFLIHVRDESLQIWSDESIYEKVLEEALPNEFRGMGTLWSEQQMSVIYGGIERTLYRDIPVHSNYRSTFMALQYFAHNHPEYDFFWNWEMDTRYTGHFYHLFDRTTKWAKQQPRKGLWERNARFYIPSEHGSWEDFKQMVRVQTEHGTNSKNNLWGPHHQPFSESDQMTGFQEKPIWGPERPEFDEVDTANAPYPPTTYEKDKYEWGVDEEADLITFNPLFDPESTGWILAEDVTGYNTTSGLPPRRTAIITNSRLSKRLLTTMHLETSKYKHTMFSEMWPGSCALHHGLKAVYVPHPEFIDRKWPTDYLAAIFNGGRNGASGGSRTSVFSDDRQHNFLGLSWYYHAGAPANLWKRWLGYKVNNDGGEEWELANEGRMCLPAILLHPVKQVDLVIG